MKAAWGWSIRIGCLALLAGPGCAAPESGSDRVPPALWGTLDAGPHRVGLEVRFSRDTTRAGFGTGSERDGRPMQVVVWYPASASAGRRVTLSDYVGLSATALDAGAPPASRVEELLEAFAAEPASRGIPHPRIDSVLSLPLYAVRAAPRAPGRFPLVVFLHAAPWAASVMSEYLASHGFVVAAIESKGAREPAYRLSRENLEAMERDAAFTIGLMRRDGSVSDRLGIIGMSNGAIAAMALQLTESAPDAIVSLDGGIGEAAGGTWLAWRSENSSHRFRAHLLHLYTPDNPHLALQYLRSYGSGPRTLVRINGLRHADFLAYAALGRVSPGLFGPAPAVSPVGFELVCRNTRLFLEWQLTGAPSAARVFDPDPEAHEAPPGLVAVEFLPPDSTR